MNPQGLISVALVALVLCGGATQPGRAEPPPPHPWYRDAGAVDGANMWVANQGSGNVTKVRVSDAVVLATLPVGSTPLGQFVDGRLKRIEYAPSPWPGLPPVSRAAADSLLTGEYARRSYERTLGMSDIEAVTGGPGYRASWIIDGRAGPTVVASRWIWEVEPGKILYVSEEPGRRAGQPVIRDVPR